MPLTSQTSQCSSQALSLCMDLNTPNVFGYTIIHLSATRLTPLPLQPTTQSPQTLHAPCNKTAAKTRATQHKQNPQYSPTTSVMARNEQLTPLNLLKQICLLQTIYYTIIFILVAFSCSVSGDPFSVGLIFDWHSVRYDTTIGWTISMLWLIDTVFSVLAMTVIVGRSKLALDFTLTLHVINLIISTVYTRAIPTNGLWWLIQGTSTVLMTILGTWTSQWRELRKTFFEEGYEMVRPRQGAVPQAETSV